ncbi:MAG: ABC transporter substrate-binding protein [Anaerolineae bacterium]
MSRRELLRKGALGVGATVLAACQPQAADKGDVVGETAVMQGTPTAVEKTETAVEAAGVRKDVHSYVYNPTEWTTRSAEHPVVVNATRILAQRFEETNPDIKIVFVEGPGGTYQDFYAWLSAMVAAGTAPDLTWNNHNYAVQNGWALPIGEYLDQPNPYAPGYKAWRDIFYPAYMESLKQPDGREYCAPVNAIYPNVEVGLACNKDMLSQLGLNLPATWAEEMEIAKALKQAGNGLSPWPVEKADGNMWPLALQILPSMMQPICPEMDLNGDKFVGIEECLPAFKKGLVGPKTPIYRRAFAEMFKLASYWVEGFATSDLDLMWREGKIGMAYCGSWEFSQIASDPNVKFERGFVPPPIPSSRDIPPLNGVPGATDAPRMTAGDGTVPGELVKAVQGAETVIIANSVQTRKNQAETLKWWQWLTEPQNNAFMVNENQDRIPSAKDAPLGPIWKEIASFKLPLYDYGIAWWGQGLYWDIENFNTWRKICMEFITGQIDEDTFYDLQQKEWEEASARYEKVLEEQKTKQ